MQHLPAFEYQRARWRNERGWTREIAAETSADGQLMWRASIAEIDQDGGFSEFVGLQRDQVLVSGNGFRLDFDNSPTISALPPHERIRYPGSPAPRCRLIDGPSQAFNLFHDPQRVGAQLMHRPLVGTMVVFCRPGQRWLIYLLGGRLIAQRRGVIASLEQGDSLWLDAFDDTPTETPDGSTDAAAARRTLLEGGGELLMVSFTAADAESA